VNADGGGLLTENAKNIKIIKKIIIFKQLPHKPLSLVLATPHNGTQFLPFLEAFFVPQTDLK